MERQRGEFWRTPRARSPVKTVDEYIADIHARTQQKAWAARVKLLGYSEGHRLRAAAAAGQPHSPYPSKLTKAENQRPGLDEAPADVPVPDTLVLPSDQPSSQKQLPSPESSSSSETEFSSGEASLPESKIFPETGERASMREWLNHVRRKARSHPLPPEPKAPSPFRPGFPTGPDVDLPSIPGDSELGVGGEMLAATLALCREISLGNSQPIPLATDDTNMVEAHHPERKETARGNDSPENLTSLSGVCDWHNEYHVEAVKGEGNQEGKTLDAQEGGGRRDEGQREEAQQEDAQREDAQQEEPQQGEEVKEGQQHQSPRKKQRTKSEL